MERALKALCATTGLLPEDYNGYESEVEPVAAALIETRREAIEEAGRLLEQYWFGDLATFVRTKLGDREEGGG